ncbi:uncharacterized protein LOC122043521 [Zingiber officinale]|uniref:uncharacterized protein LOC122043521 n=1 Tax=Zingiber officinale TaxID=94328 RepID=UPI001C4BE4B0|nr:uncharacterized protein LOC122043521 [Zingiber officinale]
MILGLKVKVGFCLFSDFCLQHRWRCFRVEVREGQVVANNLEGKSGTVYAAPSVGAHLPPHWTSWPSSGFGLHQPLAGLRAQQDFLRSTDLAAERFFLSAESNPALDETFAKFVTMYPKYQSSSRIDGLHCEEYYHLADAGARICLDYCGFGLVSYLQSFQV